MTQTSLTPNQRIPELDGLRGCAVLMVLVWHFIGQILNFDLGIVAEGAARVLMLGRTGVDLFFVLSGFLITGIILDRTRGISDFLKSFYVRRALRILPPYLLLIAIFWICTWSFGPTRIFNDSTPIWYHLTFTQNYWMVIHEIWGPDGVSITWSVAIEEQFYLCYPLLALLIPRKWLAFALVAVAVSSAVFRYFYWVYEDGNSWAGYVFTLCRLDGLAIGGLVACAWRDPVVMEWLKARKSRLVNAVCIASLGFVMLAICLSRNVDWHMYVWGHAFLSLFYGLLLTSILTCDLKKLKALLRSAFLRYFGRISYSIYLFHPLILSLMFLAFGRYHKLSGWPDAGICLLAFVSTLIVAQILYRLLEAPCIDRGRRFAY